MLRDEIVTQPWRLWGDQWIEDDPAGIALHEGDIGKVVAAHLENSVHARRNSPYFMLSCALRHKLGLTIRAQACRRRYRLL